MDIKAVRRPSVYNRLGGGPSNGNNIVCIYWLKGTCNRNPCRFVHGEPQSAQPKVVKGSHLLLQDGPRRIPYCSPKNSQILATGQSGSVDKSSNKNIKVVKESHLLLEDGTRKIPSCSPKNSQILAIGQSRSVDKSSNKNSKVVKESHLLPEDGTRKIPSCSPKNSQILATGQTGSVDKSSNQETPKRLCEYWAVGNCVKGDKCCFLHSWFRGHDFSLLAKLQGHKKAVTGIALPSGSDKLYSGSKDGTTRVWDCHTGQCVKVINLKGEIGSLLSEGPWIFVGIPDAVKAWNIQTSADFTLTGPVGQVYAMIVGYDMLFAGVQGGSIVVWKAGSETNPFQPAGSLDGHSSAVISLAVGKNILYSGSMDHTIRMWDLGTLQCVQTLNGHSEAVTSLICWDRFLLSSSLDRTIKVWAATESGSLEVTYINNEEQGVISLSGMNDAQGKPILLCSCNDDSVHLYELPSFTERGRIFAKREVRAIQIGPGGLFFSGDGTGLLSVWNWQSSTKAET